MPVFAATISAETTVMKLLPIPIFMPATMFGMTAGIVT